MELLCPVRATGNTFFFFPAGQALKPYEVVEGRYEHRTCLLSAVAILIKVSSWGFEHHTFTSKALTSCDSHISKST